MGDFTGGNALAVFIDPNAFKPLARQYASELKTAGGELVGVPELVIVPGDGARRGRAQLHGVLHIIQWRGLLQFDVTVRIDVTVAIQRSPEGIVSLRAAVVPESLEVEGRGLIGNLVRERVVQRLGTVLRSDVKRAHEIPLPIDTFASITDVPAAEWAFACEWVLPSRGDRGYLAVAAQRGATAPLGVRDPLPTRRELAVCVDLAFLAKRLEKLARSRPLSLPVGLQLEQLSIRPDLGALALSATLVRRFGKLDFGASRIMVDARVLLAFDRRLQNAELVVRDVRTSVDGGLAWGLALPALGPWLTGLVRDLVRDTATGSLLRSVNRTLDEGEGELRDLFGEAANLGVDIKLRAAAVRGRDLWVCADVG